MQHRLDQGRPRHTPITAEFEWFGDKIVGSAPWPYSGEGRERFMVFTVRDHKIVHMKGFESRHDAERFARRR